jgi:invasion protein IalB
MNFTAFLSCWRAGAVCAAAVVALAAAFASAEAATKKTDKKTEAAKPNLVASFGDWNVFVSQAGKGRICYVLAQPKSREPDDLKRDPGYAFISDRPAEGVRNEVSFIMGFDVAGGTTAEASAETATDATPDAKPAKPGAKPAARTAKHAKTEAKAKAKPIGAPVATVDEQSFELLPKGADLWVKNAARESALIAEMKKGATIEIKASSLKGNESTDSYSLSGFSQAMERLQKECPPK